MPVALAPMHTALAQAAGEAPGGTAPAPSGVMGALLALGAAAWVLQAITVALQVACVVHVVRRREDYWWIFLILFFPLVGSLVYLVVVVWPEWRRRRRWPHGGSAAGGLGSGRRRLKALEERVALSGTVDDRAELAAAYAAAGDYSRSRECYEACLQGAHARDPHLLAGMAHAGFGEGQFDRCLECLSRVDRREVPERVRELDLLEAKALLALGRDAEGIARLRALAPKAPGLEPWWRLAEALSRRGEADEADEACRRLVEEARRLGPASRKREKAWIALAGERLKARS